MVHGWARSIHWGVVGRLACGSLPASILTLTILWRLNLNGEVTRSLINLVLCGALFLTALALIFRNAIMDRYRQRLDRVSPANTSLITVLVGAALGVLVSISSVGAGAVGVTALLRRLLYPLSSRWRVSSAPTSPTRCRSLWWPGADTGSRARSIGT